MKLFKNLLAYSIGDILGKGILIIISPILTRLLLPEEYGAMGLFAAIWGVLSVFQFGGMDASYQFFRTHTTDVNERNRIQVSATYVSIIAFFSIWTLFFLSSFYSEVILNYINISQENLLLLLLGLIPTFFSIRGKTR